MQLVLNPWQYDVIVTTNLFGDILWDLMAGLVGGLGLAPGANVGENAAILEAVHGSAPDIAGKGMANPVSILLAAGLMLEHVGRLDLSQSCDPRSTGRSTRPRCGRATWADKASTKEFAQAIIRQLSASPADPRMKRGSS